MITIQRIWRTTHSTCGKLTLDDSPWYCYTLEPAIPIQAGTYNARMEVSPHFTAMLGTKTLTPHLKGVPGFDDEGPHGPIEIHIGNTPENTGGCCLVGLTHPEDDFIGESRAAFFKLISLLSEEFQVCYIDLQIVTDPELGL